DILDIPLSSIPYILFKLEEIKKSEALSLCQYAKMLLGTRTALTLFSLH
ncbi:MAG: hypothetical protein JWQ27_2177, partial [Ferruginibacter sp.]|nr:hypothetical protein [Ferruginibacter sp.]